MVRGHRDPPSRRRAGDAGGVRGEGERGSRGGRGCDWRAADHAVCCEPRGVEACLGVPVRDARSDDRGFRGHYLQRQPHRSRRGVRCSDSRGLLGEGACRTGARMATLPRRLPHNRDGARPAGGHSPAEAAHSPPHAAVRPA